MKVERFERLTTSVWTLTLPNSVRCALGMRAAMSFSCSGSGLSMGWAGAGGRKGFWARGGVFPWGSRPGAVLHKGGMERGGLPPQATHVIERLRRSRRWLLLVLGLVAVGLLPWIAYLSAT